MIGPRIRFAVIALALVAATLTISVRPAASASEVTVGIFGCLNLPFGDGQKTVPAGSTIVFRFGDTEVNRGMLTAFLLDQTTTLSLNGGAPFNANALYPPPSQNPDGTWSSNVFFPTGVTLTNPADSLTFTFTQSLAHKFAEELNGPVAINLGFEPGQPIFSGPGVTISGTCVVTAV